MLQLVTTSDGSKTIFNSEVGENYHSHHGALQESTHVFLNSGLKYFLTDKPVKEVNILEVGLGTGLNFLLSADFCAEQSIHLNYCGIEAFPLTDRLIAETGYGEYVSASLWSSFLDKYASSINNSINLNSLCRLKTAHCKLIEFQTDQQFDIVYFDAFAVNYQPEMWTEESLKHISQFLKPGGIFVTYAITGNLKRSMKSFGFSIEKAPGAPGKREMLRAIKQPEI